MSSTAVVTGKLCDIWCEKKISVEEIILFCLSFSLMVNVLNILNTRVSNKMTYANSADPDQTAP